MMLCPLNVALKLNRFVNVTSTFNIRKEYFKARYFSIPLACCFYTNQLTGFFVPFTCGKKQHANGIEKYRALKYSPLILKLQITFTKRLSFKTTFKGHSIINYLNRAFTKDVIKTQNQCQIWIYLKTTCCVQLNMA